jgi:flagellar basal body-associated protein FliL
MIMDKEKKVGRFLISRLIGFFLFGFFVCLTIFWNGNILGFLSLETFLIVFGGVFALLLLTYGRDFFRFLVHAFAAFFFEPAKNKLFAEIAAMGGRYIAGMGAVGSAIGLITMLMSLDDPSRLGCGMALAMLSVLYGVIGTFLFISLGHFFSEKTEGANAEKAPFLKALVSVILIFFVFLGFTVLLTLLTSFSPKELPMPPVMPEINGDEVVMPPVVANISQTQGTRYVKFVAVFKLSSPSITNYFEPCSRKNPQGIFNKIRARLNETASDKSLSGLLPMDSKKRLAAELKTEVNHLLKMQNASGSVKEVYFPEYLIQ